MRIPFIFIELIALTLALGSPHNVSSHKTNNRTGYRHAPGELIWEDNFDSFDFDSWQHEITMSGGGVSPNTIFDFFLSRFIQIYIPF